MKLFNANSVATNLSKLRKNEQTTVQTFLFRSTANISKILYAKLIFKTIPQKKRTLLKIRFFFSLSINFFHFTYKKTNDTDSYQ